MYILINGQDKRFPLSMRNKPNGNIQLKIILCIPCTKSDQIGLRFVVKAIFELLKPSKSVKQNFLVEYLCHEHNPLGIRIHLILGCFVRHTKLVICYDL